MTKKLKAQSILALLEVERRSKKALELRKLDLVDLVKGIVTHELMRSGLDMSLATYRENPAKRTPSEDYTALVNLRGRRNQDLEAMYHELRRREKIYSEE